MNVQRVTLVEGCDMCGKTQIAQELSRRTGIPYFKATSEHASYLSSRKVDRSTDFIHQLRYADPRVFDLLKQTGYSLIFDRGFPSEYVYSTVMNRPTDRNMLQHMDEMWASLDARVVVCYRTSYEGIVDDLDPNIDEHVLKRLTSEYFKWADEKTRCKVLKLNVDDGDLDREVDEVLDFMGYSAATRLTMLSQAMGEYDDAPDTRRDGT